MTTAGAVATQRLRLVSLDLLPAERPAANPPAAVAVVDGWERLTDGRSTLS